MRQIFRLLHATMEKSVTLMEDSNPNKAVLLQENAIRDRRNAWRYMSDELPLAYMARHTNHSKLAEAMTTGDFPNALGTYVSRKLLPGYKKKKFNFEPLVWNDQTANYLPVSRMQNRAGLDDLEVVMSLDSPRPGNYDDAVMREYQVYDWMKVYPFDRHAIVNDDIGYFSKIFGDLGKAARRTLEKFVSRLYNNATSRNRMIALGANYYSTAKLTTDAISLNRMALNQRVDGRGEPINASVRYLVHHSGLVDVVRVIRSSERQPETDLNAANVVAGDFIPIEDPYMEGTAPDLPWYTFTDPNDDDIIPLVLARMVGVPEPAFIQKTNQSETLTNLGMNGLPTTHPAMMGDYLTGQLSVKIHDIWGTYIDAIAGNWFDENGGFYNDGTA